MSDPTSRSELGARLARFAESTEESNWQARAAWYKMRDAMLQDILNAWTNPGPHPEYHRRMQVEVHQAMPTLARALEAAAREARRPVTPADKEHQS